MGLFVHIAPEPVAKRIKAAGIKARCKHVPDTDPLRGVYALPALHARLDKRARRSDISPMIPRHNMTLKSKKPLETGVELRRAL